jgi:minor histocompatibility antigen H13
MACCLYITLLRFSPACILSFLATALVRGELIDAWNWVDDPEQQLRTDMQDQKDPASLTHRHASPLQNGSTGGHAGDETEGGEEVVEQITIDGDADPKLKKKKNKKRA